jgi:hypothetical protein
VRELGKVVCVDQERSATSLLLVRGDGLDAIARISVVRVTVRVGNEKMTVQLSAARKYGRGMKE